jgi:hypothetical protein
MNIKLNTAVDEMMGRGLMLGEPFKRYDFDSGPNRDRCTVVSNRRTQKCGLIHYSDMSEEISYHLLSFRKLNWLETEGFTTKHILGKMGKDVLKQIDKREFPYALSIEGD